VFANENETYGAEIDNSDVPGKSVTITNGTFDQNTGTGITLTTEGTVIWNTGGASGNQSVVTYGAVIDADSGITAYAVTLSNLKFNDNLFGGLKVSALGKATLTNITASDNADADGLNIDLSGGIGAVAMTGITAERNNGNGVIALTTNTLTITNARLNSNNSNGIQATANGNVALNAVTSWFNGLGGTGDGLNLILTTPHPVSILNSVFMGNYDSGIDITGMDNGIIKYVPILTGTMYFGNLRTNSPHLNLYLH